MEKNTGIEKFIEDFVKKIPLPQIGKESSAEILHSEKSKLVFPKTRDGKPRSSEQETKLLFIQELEKLKKFFYSVETPTKKKYKDFGIGEPKQADDGESGSIDLSLHNEKGERIALIEFKHGMPNSKNIEKDFLKLLMDDPGIKQNYFIHSVKKLEKRQIKSVEEKYNASLESLKKAKVKPKSNVKIFLFAIDGKSRVYEIDESLSLNLKESV